MLEARTAAAYSVEPAVPEDIPAIAALFTESFRESVIHHCGKLPKPLAMEDVFRLVYQTEPEAALVARVPGNERQIIGYCFAPTRLSGLWARAIFGGHLVKWFWRWITGQYGFGLYPIKIIVLNKLAFLRSSMVPAQAANARILTIAVSASVRVQGVASRLMGGAMDYFRRQKAARIRLEVRPDNVPAIRVYEKYGFVSAGLTRDSQGDWLIMLKEME